MSQYTMTLSQVVPRATATLPSPNNQGADLSQWCGSVFDQLWEGSCTACTTRDYLLWRQNKYGYKPITDPAVNALYYFGRKICGDLNTDNGSTVHDAFLAAVQDGVIPSSKEAYDKATLYAEPPIQDVVFKASSATDIPPTTEALRASLEAGAPVGIGILVDSTLFTPADTLGYTAVVDAYTVVPNEGHAVLVVGYVPHPTYKFLYRFQNSWGTGYGENGFAWFTEAYLKKNLFEACTLDIPKIFTPAKPTVQLSVSFAHYSVPAGQPNPITIHTSQPKQSFTVTSIGPLPQPESWSGTTDAQGNFTRDMMFTLIGLYHVTVTCAGQSQTVAVDWS